MFNCYSMVWNRTLNMYNMLEVYVINYATSNFHYNTLK